MFKTNYVTTTLPALTSALSNLDLELLARETGFIKRRTPGFSAEGFLISLLQSVSHGKGALRDLAVNLAKIYPHRPLSKQAVHYRFNEQALSFLEKISQELQGSMLSTTKINVKKQVFSRVLLQDATQLRLPPKNHKHYKGISNQWGPKSAAKMDLIKDVLTGELVNIQIAHGTKQDRTTGKKVIQFIEKGDLILRDMGYFDSDVFKGIESRNAFWVSRLPANTGAYLDCGKAVEKLLVSTDLSQNVVDLDEVFVGSEKQFPARLIAIRCPEEVTSQRRAKAKAHRKKMGSKPNRLTLQREGWTLYLTNLDQIEYPSEKIHQIYSQRWNIEIQFRALKSQTKIRDLLNRVTKNKTHLSILLQVIMIFSQLTASVHATLRRHHKKECIQLSIELISSWFSNVITSIKTLTDDINYDLRHLKHDKRRKRDCQSKLAVSLF